MSTAAKLTLVAALLSCACADDRGARVIDVEGPRGPVLGPGPWPVDVVTSDGQARLFVAVGDGPFEGVQTFAVSERWTRGELPDAPLGARVRYYATVGDARAPLGSGAFAFEVVEADARAPQPTSPQACELVWRQPEPGVPIAGDDDNAPQAGVQTTVIVGGVVPDQTAGVLTVGDRRYAARGLGGLLVFGGVDVARGQTTVRVEATTPGGGRCRVSGELSGR